jgi:comEA protein
VSKEKSGTHLRILIGTALLLCAVVVAYPFFFVREPSPVVVVTDAASQAEQEESVLININTASEEELQELPGIGPVLAKRMVEYREANGGFASAEELQNVSGIGEKTFAKMKSFVVV